MLLGATAARLERSRRAYAGSPPSAHPRDTVRLMTSIPSQGILSPEREGARRQISELLQRAYWMEIETVMSYIANSINPDGVRAQEVKDSLQQDVQEELMHAQQFEQRIKELYGVVPGSMEFRPEQSYLQPAEPQTDIVHVIRGVIEAENGAISHYNRIIEAAAGWTR